jgi:hypothetical protein
MVFEWKNSGIGLGIVALGVPVYYLIQARVQKTPF